MRFATLLGLSLIALCSCNGPQVEKRVYMEKDIEGYWFTYYGLHNSDLGSQWAEDTLPDFLRLFNDVNGQRDTTYVLKHDTIFYPIITPSTSELIPRYVIEFADSHRLGLRLIPSGQSLTFYSLSDQPKFQDSLREIIVETDFGSGLVWNRDSICETINMPASCCILWTRYPDSKAKSDRLAFSRLNESYLRINSSRILFSGYRGKWKSRSRLKLRGQRHEYLISSALNSHEPAIRAIEAEVTAYVNYLNAKDRRW